MTAIDAIIAAHVTGREQLTAAQLAKARQAADFEQLEAEREQYAANEAERVRRAAEHADAVAQHEQAVAELRATFDRGRHAYSAWVSGQRELRQVLTDYERRRLRLTKRAAALGLDTDTLPPRVNAEFVLDAADRQGRGIKPAFRNPFMAQEL